MSEAVGMQIDGAAGTKPNDRSTFLEMFQLDDSPVSCDTLDLNQLVSKYAGFTRIKRLLLVATRSPNLRARAAELALEHLKQSLNTSLYLRTITAFETALPEVGVDDQWMAETEQQYASQLERADADLTTAKTRLSRDAIRESYKALGDLHYRNGDLQSALKSYVKLKETATTTKYTAEMCQLVVKTAIDLGHWRPASNHIMKGEHTDFTPEFAAQMKAAAGIVALEERQYKQAARSFLAIEHEIGTSFSDVIVQDDVVVYGTLCALASLDRQELRRRLIDNSAFKSFLERVPLIRDMAHDFYEGRYGSCLQRLAQFEPEMKLDLHLYSHAEYLIDRIREGLVLQYFYPYATTDLNRMAASFGLPLADMERTVANLIATGQLPARIDSQAKTLHRRQTDDRTLSLEKVLRLADAHARETHSALLRLSLLENDFVVGTSHDDRRQLAEDSDMIDMMIGNQQDAMA